MIPVVSISNLITFLVSSFISVYLWRAYKKKKEERLRYFLYFFISMSLFFLFLTAPFLIFKSTFLITLSVTVAISFLYLILAFISSVSLRILNWRKTEKVFLIIILFSLSFYYLMIFINFEPVCVSISGDFLYWVVPHSRIFWKIGSMVNGIVSGIILLPTIIFFFIGGFRNEKGFIRKRAFLMGTGIFFLTLAGIVNFIIGSIPNFTVHITASLIAVLGLLVLFVGIVILKPKSMPTPLSVNRQANEY